MRGCLVLLVIVLLLAAYGSAIAAVITATVTLAIAWLLVTAGFLAPAWLTSHFLEKYSEEDSDVRFVLSLVHAFLYGLGGLVAVILLEFDLLTAKNAAKGSIDILTCLVAVYLFGTAAYVATKIVLKIKPIIGRNVRAVLTVVATVLVITAFWSGVIYKFQTWYNCHQQTQWITSGVTFKTAELSANGTVKFTFQNNLTTATKIRTNIGPYSRKADPFVCQPGECFVTLTQLNGEELNNSWQINIATDQESPALDPLWDIYRQYAIVFGKHANEGTIVQAVSGTCDFFTLEEKYNFKEVGSVTRR